LVVCHDSVTLCPLLMAVLFAENVRVGEPGPGFPIPCDPQPMNVVRAITAVVMKQKRRMQRDSISMRPPAKYFHCELRFQAAGQSCSGRKRARAECVDSPLIFS